jgi:hypothetical protein
VDYAEGGLEMTGLVSKGVVLMLMGFRGRGNGGVEGKM